MKLLWVLRNEVSEGFSLMRGGGALLECLPKEVEPRAILPLGSLHNDPVRWHLVSCMVAHQSPVGFPTFDPKGGLWREWYFSRLNLSTFILRVCHILFAFSVNLVDIFFQNLCNRAGFMCLSKVLN